MLYRLLLYPIMAWMLASACFAVTQTEPSQNPQTDSAARAPSEVVAVFKHLQDYMKSSPLDFETSFDARADGDELFRGSVHFLIRQPNRLRAESSFGDASYLVISDGTVMTIYNPKQRKFSQTTAPDSTARAFGFFTGEIGVESQVLEFLNVVDDVVAGSGDLTVTAAGSGTIGGRQCDKFTVTSATGDETWEAWLEKSDTPLLCKLVYSNVDGPTQTNEFSWKPTPVFSQATFVFSPPQGTTKVDMGNLGLSLPE